MVVVLAITTSAELLDPLVQSSLTDVTPWSRNIGYDEYTNQFHFCNDVYINKKNMEEYEKMIAIYLCRKKNSFVVLSCCAYSYRY